MFKALHWVCCLNVAIYLHLYVSIFIVTGNETLNGLAVDAAKGALDMAQVETDDVDLVIMCTSTPDDLFGGGARVCSRIHFSCMIP